MACPGSGTSRKRKRHDPEDERERGHEDWPETQPGGLDRGGRGGEALVFLQHRVLDDQDRVLRRQAEQRHQPDLEIDVVGEPGDAGKR